MAEAKTEGAKETSPFQKFVGDLNAYLEKGGARITTLLGVEKRPGELTGVEGVKFLAGVCQLTDDFLIEEYYEHKKRKMPGNDKAFQKAIEELSGKKVDKAIFQGIQENIKPWFEEFEGLKPEIKDRVKAGKEPIGEYPVELITPEKVVFALMLLYQAQSEKVNLVPELLKANADKIGKTLKDTIKGHKSQRRWRNVGPSGVAIYLTALTLTIGSALGISYIAGRALSSVEGASRFFEGLRDSIAPLAEGNRNLGRNNRHQEYLDLKQSLSQGWPNQIGADNLLGYLDPTQDPDGNGWQSIVEFCGPQCYLDGSIIPADGKDEIMDLFQINEADYTYYQQHPDELPAHLKLVYPDKGWLAELFMVSPNTNLEAAGQTDYEKWLEKWRQQSNLSVGVSLLGLPMIGGALGRQVRLDRRRQDFSQFRGRGRTRGRFGSTKGFA